MQNKNSSLIALSFIRFWVPDNFMRRPVEYFVDHDPEKVVIDKKLAETCVAVSVDPTTFLDLPRSVQRGIRNLSKLDKIDKKSRSKIRRILSFYHLWMANDCKCYISNEPLEFDKATRDHVFPKARGFYLSHNYMPASREHNTEKGDSWPTIGQIYRAYRAYRRLGRWFNPTTCKNNRIKFGVKFQIGLDLTMGK